MFDTIWILMSRIVFDTLILCGVLYVLARHEADYSFSKCAMVVAPVLVAPMLLYAVLVDHVPQLVGMLVCLAGAVALALYLVNKYCWVPWPKTVLVVFVVLAGHHLVGAGIEALRREVQKPAERVATPAGQSNLPSMSEKEQALMEVRTRMASRVAVHGAMDAVRSVLVSHQDLDVRLWRMPGNRKSRYDVTVYVGLPTDATAALDRLIAGIRAHADFKATGWDVRVAESGADGLRSDLPDARAATILWRPAADRRKAATDDAASIRFSTSDERFADRAILSRVEGSNLPSATARIEAAAQHAGVPMGTTADVGRRVGNRLIDGVVVKVSAPWTVEQAFGFIGAIEAAEPLAQVMRFDVKQGLAGASSGAEVHIEFLAWSAEGDAMKLLSEGGTE